ncbi:MAG: HDIG domain-containing protein [Bdellovibrionales bacterium]|nr:HDIG domain-containing protein [Bdellovibrionales bacterium]
MSIDKQNPTPKDNEIVHGSEEPAKSSVTNGTGAKLKSSTRSKYEDPSLKYLDWVHQLGLEKTFFGRYLNWLEDKFSIKRVLTVLLFCLLLAYLIFFQIKIPHNFKIGDIAAIDVVSPISFEMVDEVTTEDKKQRAEGATAVVYDYDTTVFERLAGSVYRSFRYMRTQLKSDPWPKNYQKQQARLKELLVYKLEFEKELGVPIADYLFEWLIEAKFHPKIENALIRNLDSWYDRKIADAPERYIPSGQEEVIARVIHKNNIGKELLVGRKDIYDLQNLDLFNLEDKKSIERLSETDKYNLLYLARSMLVPNLTLNKQEYASRKQKARDSVMPILISIKRNQVIIAKGSTIQPFHMAVLKQIESLQSDRKKDLMAISLALLLSISILVFFSYIKRFTMNKIKVEIKDIFVMMLVTVGIVFTTKFYMFIADATFVSKLGSYFTHAVFLFAAPVAAGPMLIGLIIQSGEVVWLFTAFLSLALGVMEDFNYTFGIVSLVGGIAAARGVYNCKKRNDIYWAGVRTGAINALLIGFLIFISKMEQDESVKDIYLIILAGFLGGIFSSLVTMMSIPLIESLFNYTTDVKLLELSNLNHPLLKEMLIKAPGTYHHSMMVGSMVEAAAEDIGANSLLAKVMSYYHDIGKMEHAKYFIENQKAGHNPHNHISPFMSRTLLIAHIKDGVELGTKYKLGKPIIDGVVQHHGTTLISFFYNKAIELRQDSDAEISEAEFRYPGPKPQFRESALVMLADSIEAAARSLDEPTPMRLQNIVRNIIQRKFTDGQLDQCNLTLKDLSKVEQAFVKILLGIYHQRIDYPKSAGGGLGYINANQS